MYYRNSACRSMLAVCALAAIAVPVGAKTHPAAQKKPAKFTRAQEISWHLKQAQDLYEQGEVDEAKNQWGEALRLDPGNREAKIGLKFVDAANTTPVQDKPAAPVASGPPAKIDPVAISDGVRDAIKVWAASTDIAGLSEILANKTADPFAKRLTRAFRIGIMSVDASTNYSPDPQLFDEFENFIDSTNLTPVINETESGGHRASDYGRPYGRALIKRIQQYERRAMLSGVEVGIVRPFGIDKAANHLNDVKLTIVSATHVLIDDPDFDNAVPIEAVLEEGKWRIGARAGYTLFYDTKLMRGTHRQFRAR